MSVELERTVTSGSDTPALRIAKSTWQQPPPDFAPPELPLPSPAFAQQGEALRRLQHTPEPTPLTTPLRASPSKLADALLQEEQAYLLQLRKLQTITNLGLLGAHRRAGLGPVVADMVQLSENLVQHLDPKSYFETPRQELLLEFSKTVCEVYRPYLASFELGVALPSDQKDAERLAELLDDAPPVSRGSRGATEAVDDGNASEQANLAKAVEWLIRRPLSRIKSYMSLYKKLLHASDDVTDLFLAYERVHELLVEAREALARAKEAAAAAADTGDARESVAEAEGGEEGCARELGPMETAPLQIKRDTSRSVSGGSTSTQSSSNSRISVVDELLGLQGQIDTAHTRDVFSLQPKACRLDLLPKEGEPERAVVERDTFQLQVWREKSSECINCLVELVLLTDLLLVLQPAFDRPRLLFPPLVRGVFHVTAVPAEPRLFELDIVGRETLRFTAPTATTKGQWYDLLLACENFELASSTVPVPPASLAPFVGLKSATGMLGMPPQRPPPPTPPLLSHAGFAAGPAAPLSVIREDSQLSLGNVSERSTHTPDAVDHAPFHFDHEENDATPRAEQGTDRTRLAALRKSAGAREALRESRNSGNLPKLSLLEALKAGGGEGETDDESELGSATPKAIAFPEPPVRSLAGRPAAMTRARTEALPRQTMAKLSLTPQLATRSASAGDMARAAVGNGDEAEEEGDVDRPQLPLLSFGDGKARPSSFALNFSPNTLTTFGIPTRQVPVPKAMVLPDAAPAPKSPARRTLSQRRTGGDLAIVPALPATIAKDGAAQAARRDVECELMAECFSWDQGTWVPLIMDNVDDAGKVKAVRSTLVSIYSLHDSDSGGASRENGDNSARFVEIFDKKADRALGNYAIGIQTSIIRDDACDVSVGLDVGLDKVYFLFRSASPRDADAFFDTLVRAKHAAALHPPRPQQLQLEAAQMPPTPATVHSEAISDGLGVGEGDAGAGIGAVAVDSLKIKLYRFELGKWVNRGSARLTIRHIPNTRRKRLVLMGKTKKGERVLLTDTVVGCDAVAADGDKSAGAGAGSGAAGVGRPAEEIVQPISKIGISLKLELETLMMQFRSDKERNRILDLLLLSSSTIGAVASSAASASAPGSVTGVSAAAGAKEREGEKEDRSKLSGFVSNFSRKLSTVNEYPPIQHNAVPFLPADNTPVSRLQYGASGAQYL